MTDWVLIRVIGFLAAAAAAASTHYGWLAEQNARPGQHRVDRNFGPSRLEFYTAEGQFYLRLSRWLKLAAFVMIVWWIYVAATYRYGIN
jgi:hypothetical protein